MPAIDIDDDGHPESIGNLLTLRGNSHLWKLKFAVDDKQHIRIFEDFRELFGRSYRLVTEAIAEENQDFLDFIQDSEGEYVEDLIGSSFIILQTKLRRVKTEARKLAKSMNEDHGIEIPRLVDAVQSMGRTVLKTPKTSFAGAVWATANYFKHRDEWDLRWWPITSTWSEAETDLAGENPPTVRRDRDKDKERAMPTIRIMEAMGLAPLSTGNMIASYKFFGVNDLRDCVVLAEDIQSWAESVLQEAKDCLRRALKTAP